MSTKKTISKMLFSKERVELNAFKEAQNFGNSLNKLKDSIKDLTQQEE